MEEINNFPVYPLELDSDTIDARYYTQYVRYYMNEKGERIIKYVWYVRKITQKKLTKRILKCRTYEGFIKVKERTMFSLSNNIDLFYYLLGFDRMFEILVTYARNYPRSINHITILRTIDNHNFDLVHKLTSMPDETIIVNRYRLEFLLLAGFYHYSELDEISLQILESSQRINIYEENIKLS